MMISIDLKNRQITNIRHYSTYGDELPINQETFIDSTKKALATEADGLAALRAVLLENDRLFDIPQRILYSSPPGPDWGREPASGWDYDW
jgi:hypothetical protein